MARKVGLNLIGCSIVAMVFIIGVTEATNYTVGDSFGWNVPTNESFYIDWANSKRFFVGDHLIFKWNGDHSVGIRTESSYFDNCNTSLHGGLTFKFNGTDSIYQHQIVSPAGPLYFLCTVGNHCQKGQKFSIKIESHPHSAASTLSFSIFSALLSAFLLYFFTLSS